MPTENNLQPGLVSIMTPAYNAAEFIQSAIESVLAQTYPQWELIVVNDGSSDDTAQILKGFSDSRIRVIEQANAGEAAARNRALDVSRGEFLAFLDADDQFLPEFLALALAFLSGHPQCDAVYSDGYYIDRQDAVIGRLSDQRRGPFEGDLLEALIRASDVFGPPICTLLKRQVWLDHPLRFDPQIVIGPDWDFFTRMAQYQHYSYGVSRWRSAAAKPFNCRVSQRAVWKPAAMSSMICWSTCSAVRLTASKRSLDGQLFGRCRKPNRRACFA
jgi:glycosyltransferase involved in cell wall biosynthesis